MRIRALLFGLLTVASWGVAGAMEVGTNFWDVGWGGEANDPFVDGYKNVTGDNPWKPEFLEEIRIYTVFRFMDWGKTNNAVEAHGGKTRWEDRVQKSAPEQRPMAYEWMIDLCNRTQRDMWVSGAARLRHQDRPVQFQDGNGQADQREVGCVEIVGPTTGWPVLDGQHTSVDQDAVEQQRRRMIAVGKRVLSGLAAGR